MDKLRLIRTQRGMKQKDVAKYLGISAPAYNHYESGRNEPDLYTLRRLAELYGITIDELAGNIEEGLSFGKTPTLVPMLRRVLLDRNDTIIREVIGYVSGEENFTKCYAMMQSGSSMSPEINDGDVVIFSSTQSIKSGSIAVVCINGDEGTVKRISTSDNSLILTPANPDYKPMHFSSEQVESLPIKIVGQVIQVRRNYK